jgi:hypothetical protein
MWDEDVSGLSYDTVLTTRRFEDELLRFIIASYSLVEKARQSSEPSASSKSNSESFLTSTAIWFFEKLYVLDLLVSRPAKK